MKTLQLKRLNVNTVTNYTQLEHVFHAERSAVCPGHAVCMCVEKHAPNVVALLQQAAQYSTLPEPADPSSAQSALGIQPQEVGVSLRVSARSPGSRRPPHRLSLFRSAYSVSSLSPLSGAQSEPKAATVDPGRSHRDDTRGETPLHLQSASAGRDTEGERGEGEEGSAGLNIQRGAAFPSLPLPLFLSVHGVLPAILRAHSSGLCVPVHPPSL